MNTRQHFLQRHKIFVRRSLFFVSFFLLLPPLFAQGAEDDDNRLFAKNDILFSITGSISLGQSEEIVYRNSKTNDYLSQLLWDMLPLFNLGFSFEFLPKDPVTKSGFFSVFKARFALPGISGVMQDRDWDPELWSYPGELTNFSEHDNRTRSSILLEANAGWSFPLRSRFAIKPYINLSYLSFSFSAMDGYKEYKESNWKPSDFYGEVITFSQFFYSVGPGVLFYFPFNDYFSFEFFTHLGYVFYYLGEDNHLRRGELFREGIQFIDYTHWGMDINAGTKVRFLPAGKISFALDLSFKDILLVRGATAYRNQNDGEWSRASNVSGAGVLLFDIGLSATVKL